MGKDINNFKTLVSRPTLHVNDVIKNVIDDMDGYIDQKIKMGSQLIPSPEEQKIEYMAGVMAKMIRSHPDYENMIDSQAESRVQDYANLIDQAMRLTSDRIRKDSNRLAKKKLQPILENKAKMLREGTTGI